MAKKRTRWIAAGSILLVALLVASPATAQMVCAERDKFLKRLGNGYAEAPVAMGLTSDGTVLEVLTSTKGTWTIIITKPSGQSCIVASGEAWEQIEPRLAGSGT